MRCPFCGATEARVVDTRDVNDAIRRRRECETCHQRFTTYERIASVNLLVVKRDQRREKFDREKLAREIEAELYALGESEVPSRVIGEMVMRRLRDIDGVAYVRFASVYRRFEDIDRMADEIEALKAEIRRQAELRNQLQLPL